MPAVPETEIMMPDRPAYEATSSEVPDFAGDPEAFARLVREHQDRLCNFLRRYTRNTQDAEDLAQDTFVKAYKNLHRYEHRTSFAAWLYTIARRTLYNHHRDTRRTEELDFDVACDATTPSASVEHAEQNDSVWQYVRQLKSPYQEVVVLKYLEEMSIEEIAKVLNRSQTGVKILLFRARNQLRKLHPAPLSQS